MDGRTDDAKTISLRLRRGIKLVNHCPTEPGFTMSKDIVAEDQMASVSIKF